MFPSATPTNICVVHDLKVLRFCQAGTCYSRKKLRSELSSRVVFGFKTSWWFCNDGLWLLCFGLPFCFSRFSVVSLLPIFLSSCSVFGRLHISIRLDFFFVSFFNPDTMNPVFHPSVFDLYSDEDARSVGIESNTGSKCGDEMQFTPAYSVDE